MGGSADARVMGDGDGNEDKAGTPAKLPRRSANHRGAVEHPEADTKVAAPENACPSGGVPKEKGSVPEDNGKDKSTPIG